MVRAMPRLIAALTVLGALTLSACDPLDPAGPRPPEEILFSLSPSGITLGVGESATVTPSLARKNGEQVNPKSLKWESSAEGYATVTQDGVVTGVAPGQALIVARSGNISDTTRVKVVEAADPRPGVNITPDSVVLQWLGATATFTATVRDDAGTVVANPGLTWKSLNPAIAQVNSSGVVTAKGVGLALIVATATCCDQADTAYARVDQVVDAVEIEQDSVVLAQGSSAQLNAIALDRSGSPIEDATLAWTSADESVARVSDDGLVTSQSAGTTKVTAASGGQSDRIDVAVTGSSTPTGGGSARHPNEPAGFVPWFVHDWQSFPDGETCVVPASGEGYFVFCGVSAHVGRATLINDGNAPHGFGKSLRVHWPAGFPTGHGMFNYAIRSTPHLTSPARTETAIPLQKWYISTWVYLEPEAGGGWEMHFDQLRHFTMNRHVTSGSEGGRTIAGWTLRGVLPYSGSSVDWEKGERMDTLRDYRLWGYRCDGCSTSTHARVEPGVAVGEWVHMELLFDRTVKPPPLFATGDPGIGPVRVKYWANGTLRMDRVLDNVYMAYPFMELFFNLNQSGGVAPNGDKYIRLSGTYISGEVYHGS
jgi:uncharacterized protein YjdB